MSALPMWVSGRSLGVRPSGCVQVPLGVLFSPPVTVGPCVPAREPVV